MFKYPQSIGINNNGFPVDLRINALEIPQSEKELIFYQNAQELFHIAH
jgi:hypothetical protein